VNPSVIALLCFSACLCQSCEFCNFCTQSSPNS